MHDDDEIYEDDDLFADDEFEDGDELDRQEQFQAAVEQYNAAVQFEVEQHEKRIGRDLTQAEHAAVAQGAEAQFYRGVHPDIGRALEDVGVPAKPVGEMGHQDAVQFMVQRMQDQQPSPEDAIPEDREFDLDNQQDRVDYMTARAQGVAFEGGDDAA